MRLFKIVAIVVLGGYLSSCSTGADVSSDLASKRAVIPVIIGDGSNKDLVPGDEIPIQWEITASQPSRIEIQISRDGGLTWETVETNLVNTGTYNLEVPKIPGVIYRTRVVGVGEDTAIAESDDFATEPLADIIVGSGGNLEPSTEISMNWKYEEYQPSVLDMQYCVPTAEDDCTKDTSTWTTVKTGIANQAPTSGTNNSVTGPVPYLPGVGIIYRLVGEYEGKTETYAKSGTINIESDQAKMIGSFNGGGGLQTGTGTNTSNETIAGGKYTQITVKARVAPYISPTVVTNATPVAGNEDRFKTITVKAFTRLVK